jgi:murein DD-endopeptidase MepM/ murein hydrolase activator NlpD
MQNKRRARIAHPKIKGLRRKNISRPQTIKLSVCIGIFLSLVLIKLFDPTGSEQLSGVVNAHIGDQTPTTMQAIGQAITDGESIMDVFRNLGAVLTGSVDEEEEEKHPPSVDERALNAETRMQTPVVPVTAYVAYEEDSIPIIAYEGELMSGGGFGIDDTLPLPFGYDAPPNVDFTMQTFGFKHTPPLYGTITSRFGYRTHPVQGEPMFHYGIDIAANTGTEIRSFADGTVADVGKSNTYGNYVLITHRDGLSSFYAHCNRILVRRGANVEMGQAIAQVGNTGASTGPHLHFELRLDGKLIDPEFYIHAE